MTGTMRKMIIMELARSYEIIKHEGYTEEAEAIQDRIAWYCMRNNISEEEMNAIQTEAEAFIK